MRAQKQTPSASSAAARRPGRLDQVFYVLVPVVLLVVFALAWSSFRIHSPVVTVSTGDYLPRHLHDGAVLIQRFTSPGGRLGSIGLSFERGTPAEETYDIEIAVRIHETDLGGRIIDPANPLYQETLTGADIRTFADTTLVTRSLRLAPGSSYAIEVEAIRVPDEARLAIRTAGAPEGGLYENGIRRQTLALYTVMTYTRFDALSLAGALALAVLVLLVAYGVFKPLDRWAARARFWPLFFYPLLLIPIAELLNTLNTDLILPPIVILLTYLLVLGVVFLFFFLTRHVVAAIFLSDVLLITLASVNHSKIYFRGDPLFAGDLLLAGEAVTSLKDLHFQVSIRMLFAVILLLLTLVVFRRSKWRPAFTWRMPALAGGTAVILAAYGWLVLCNPAVMQDGFGINRYAWNQMTNYKKNGFLLSFTGSIANLSIDIPSYIQPGLAGLYEVPPPADGEPDIQDKPHIIVVMSESYTDFRTIRDLPLTEPVMPYFDSLMTRDDVVSGEMLVSIFGGGTCNTEFEFLTGGSMLFLQDGVIPYSSYMKRPTHSVCSVLKEQGYRNVAVHPYIRTFWDRHTVYPNLGFDEFISMEGFEDPEIIRSFISDRSCFERIVEEFEQTGDDERLFLYAVTMQNHFPYYVDEDRLGGIQYHIQLNGLTDMESAEMYFSLLRQSDDALRYLIKYFESQEEPVILVFFGDHLPGNNQELMPFYEYLFDGEIANLNLVQTRQMYETPFFVWSNTVDLPKQEIEIISPNLLGAYVLDAAGVRMSPYFEYVNGLRSAVSAINSKTIIDTSNRAYDRTNLSSDLETLMNRYWVYVYDNIVRDND